MQPLLDRAERFGLQPVDASLAVDRRLDQPGIAQHLQVLRHRRLTEPELVDQLPHGVLGVEEQVEDLAAVRLGEHLEHRLSMPYQLYNCQGMFTYSTSRLPGGAIDGSECGRSRAESERGRAGECFQTR